MHEKALFVFGVILIIICFFTFRQFFSFSKTEPLSDDKFFTYGFGKLHIIYQTRTVFMKLLRSLSSCLTSLLL